MNDPLRAIGFFRELDHGKKHGPSLVESKGLLPASLREPLAAYLRACKWIAYTPCVAFPSTHRDATPARSVRTT